MTMPKKIVSREIMIWIAFGLLLIGSGIILSWNFQRNYDFEILRKLSTEFQAKKKADSLNLVSMRIYVDELKVQNQSLLKEIVINRETIKKLNSLKVNEQYRIYLFNASYTRDYFMSKTGGGNAELEVRENDTLMITPIENIKQANIKLVELEYTIQERDQYKQMSEKQDFVIGNLDEIISVKDSMIEIKDSQIQQCDTLLQAYEKEAVKKEKKIKNQKVKTWVIGAVAAAGILVLTIVN